jgi:ATP-dependent protease ClpP protease subunit
MKKIITYVFYSLLLIFLFGPTAAYAEKIIKLKPHNTVSLIGDIDSSTTSKIINSILSNENDYLYLVIDSGGGSIEDGMKIMNAMKGSGKRFVCIATYAASMAFSIFQSCDVRLITRDATLMQHLGSYGVRGDSNKNKSYALYIERYLQKLDEYDRKRIGLSRREFEDRIRNDWWLIGQDAVSANVADKIVSVTCSKDLTEKRVVEKYSMKYSDITITYSGCPLVPYPLSVSIVNKIGATPEQSDEELKLNKIYIKIHPGSYVGSHLKEQ